MVTSVVVYWALAFATMWLYAQTRSWDEDLARKDGVFHVHDLLAATPPDEREARLTPLTRHFQVGFRLAGPSALDEVLDRPPPPGTEPWSHSRGLQHWWVLPFEDGEMALLAGPVDRSTPPPGYLPIGVLVVVITLPLLATTLAIRFDREVALVEEATDALATGELGARVIPQGGPTQELSQRFNAMAERIERLIRSRDELVQAVSHELGSPLSRLRFRLELLREAESQDGHDRFDAMARELDALDALVAELLSFVQADDRPIERHAFDPRQSLEDLAELARLDLPDHRALTIHVAIPSGARVYADQRLFLRAVENLLRNAVQHARTRVEVVVDMTPDAVAVTVDDDGPGIPEAMRDRVTEPFSRLQADRGRDTGGVGLGLAIVHRIVERHGGQVEVTSAPAGGARFVTTWPAAG